LAFTKNVNCPALLWETGFLSNKNDSDYIVSNLDKIAITLAKCILDLFEADNKYVDEVMTILNTMRGNIDDLEKLLKKNLCDDLSILIV
jgi:hypothetical protein